MQGLRLILLVVVVLFFAFHYEPRSNNRVARLGKKVVLKCAKKASKLEKRVLKRAKRELKELVAD